MNINYYYGLPFYLIVLLLVYFICIPSIIFFFLKKKIHSYSGLQWLFWKNTAIFLHIVAVSVMVYIAAIYGDHIDVGMILITAPFVFLIQYKFNSFTVGLFCFSIYLSLMYSIDRVSGYPVYYTSQLILSENSLGYDLFLIWTFININWFFCILLNLIGNFSKHALAFSFFSIFLFYSQLLPLPAVIVRQMQGARLLDINSIDSEYNDVLRKKIFFTKITSGELYAVVVDEKEVGRGVTVFKNNSLEFSHNYQKKQNKNYFLTREQEITIPKWQILLFSRNDI